eukprot:2208497-Rhodomonas_salina.3
MHLLPGRHARLRLLLCPHRTRQRLFPLLAVDLPLPLDPLSLLVCQRAVPKRARLPELAPLRHVMELARDPLQVMRVLALRPPLAVAAQQEPAHDLGRLRLLVV